MDDKDIVDLYFKRSELAICETQKKYGKYCIAIADNILNSKEDADECVNDAYNAVWNSIPPKRPERLSTYIGKLVRNKALNCLRNNHTKKKGRNNINIQIDEIAECIPDTNAKDITDSIVISNAITAFLYGLSPQTRRIFMQRYWYFRKVKDIAADTDLSLSNVNMILSRTRDKLKQYLEKEGITV